MPERDDSHFACPEMRGLNHYGHCVRCDEPLTGRKYRWCGDACARWYMSNHTWNEARSAAVARDGGCVTCGSEDRLQVNHIIPREGRGYGRGCHHHQDNLETLCHPCHVKVTNAQREERANRSQLVLSCSEESKEGR